MLAAQRSSTRRVTGASLWITGTAVAARYPTGHCVIATSHTFSPIFFGGADAVRNLQVILKKSQGLVIEERHQCNSVLLIPSIKKLHACS
jgi:hypothetical protein